MMVGPLHSKLVLGCPGKKKNLKTSGNTVVVFFVGGGGFFFTRMGG